MSSRYNLRSRKNENTSDNEVEKGKKGRKEKEEEVQDKDTSCLPQKKTKEKLKAGSNDTSRLNSQRSKSNDASRLNKEDIELLDLFLQDMNDDEDDEDYQEEEEMDEDELREYLKTIKDMLNGVLEDGEILPEEEEEGEEEEDKMNEGFIADEDDDEQKTKLAMMMLQHILQQKDDPFEAVKLTKKQKKLYNKLKGKIDNEEPTPQRILNSKMPNSEKIKMIKTLMGYSQMPEDSFEYWMFRDMLNEKLKEWETLDKTEGNELKKVMKKVENKKSILHQIAQLNAPEPVKEGIITLYNTSDMEDKTHHTRLRAVLKIPFTQLKPIQFHDKPKHILLQHVKQELDNHLYGMEGVKRELLIALNIRLSNPNVSSALLLNGKAGCGKTKISHVLANALGLYFYKISLGNIDHAQVITGGESIWKGSSLSSITQALIEGQSKNPIILLDEIDKNRGKRSSGGQSVENALLQVLDPTQNHNFRDLNIPEIPIDLSSVWWIATSNSTEHLSRPLLSRLRLIEVPEYSVDDLKNIVLRYVIPSICKKCAVDVKRIEMDEKVLQRVLLENKNNIDELGVRFLEGLFEKTIGNLLLEEVLSEGLLPKEGEQEKKEERGEGEKIIITLDDIQKKKKDEYNHLMYI